MPAAVLSIVAVRYCFEFTKMFRDTNLLFPLQYFWLSYCHSSDFVCSFIIAVSLHLLSFYNFALLSCIKERVFQRWHFNTLSFIHERMRHCMKYPLSKSPLKGEISFVSLCHLYRKLFCCLVWKDFSYSLCSLLHDILS